MIRKVCYSCSSGNVSLDARDVQIDITLDITLDINKYFKARERERQRVETKWHASQTIWPLSLPHIHPPFQHGGHIWKPHHRAVLAVTSLDAGSSRAVRDQRQRDSPVGTVGNAFESRYCFFTSGYFGLNSQLQEMTLTKTKSMKHHNWAEQFGGSKFEASLSLPNEAGPCYLVKKYINIRCEKSYNPYIHPHKNHYQKFVFSYTPTIYHIHQHNTITTATQNNILISYFIKVLPHLFSKLLSCFFVFIWS